MPWPVTPLDRAAHPAANPAFPTEATNVALDRQNGTPAREPPKHGSASLAPTGGETFGR
jgi:hypothetical protein